MRFLKRKSWNPYVTGALIGLLAMFTFYTADRPMGITKALAQTTAMIEKVFAPEYVSNNRYIQEALPMVIEGSGIDWQWMLVIGVIIGAFISSKMSGTFKKEVTPPLWESRFGISKIKRLIIAFISGIMLFLGACIAGGCTLWHGINGSMQLALSGWVFFIVVFATSVITAKIMYRGGVK
jgi:hypothetical protein